MHHGRLQRGHTRPWQPRHEHRADTRRADSSRRVRDDQCARDERRVDERFGRGNRELCDRRAPDRVGGRTEDGVLAVSNDGGQNFTARLAFNTPAGIGTTDRPVAAADPGVTDGTIYLAWAEQGLIKLRRVTVHANGYV